MARVVAVEVPHHVTQRYTELNPVRAGMVDRAERRQWSSAAAHCGVYAEDGWLAMEMSRRRWPDATTFHENVTLSFVIPPAPPAPACRGACRGSS
jgi:hypothetical protein